MSRSTSRLLIATGNSSTLTWPAGSKKTTLKNYLVLDSKNIKEISKLITVIDDYIYIHYYYVHVRIIPHYKRRYTDQQHHVECFCSCGDYCAMPIFVKFCGNFDVL